MSDYVNITQVVGAIINGALDDDIDTIREAIKSRRDMKAQILKATLKVGDKVTFVSSNPRYLQGLTATVVAKKQKRVSIQFDDKLAAGRFGHGPVNASPNMLEPIA
jgi:hypothetical protein